LRFANQFRDAARDHRVDVSPRALGLLLAGSAPHGERHGTKPVRSDLTCAHFTPAVGALAQAVQGAVDCCSHPDIEGRHGVGAEPCGRRDAIGVHPQEPFESLANGSERRTAAGGPGLVSVRTGGCE
jgi:hypothetical protein